METPDLSALFEAAQTALREENLDDVFEPLREVLEYDAGHASAWFYLGELAYARERFALAARAYDICLAVNSEDILARRSRAFALFADYRCDEALEDLEFLVRQRLLAPDDETILRLRGDCYYRLRRYAWAIDDASEAVTHLPGNDGARKWRDEIMRRCLRASEDADAYAAQLDAVQAHERARENDEPTDDLPPLDPKLAQWDEMQLRCLLVRALEDAAREDETVQAMSAMTEKFETNSLACQICGEIHLRRRDLDRARYWTERAIAISPTNGGALFQMGEIESAVARLESSAITATRALRFKLQAARREDEEALDWLQSEWDAHFGELGALNFRTVLGETDEDADNARPSDTDWDGMIEDYRSGDEYNA